MDKYVRVEKPKVQTEIRETEIRITTQGKMRNYISYATNLFQQKGATEIILKAMGRAINKTVTIAEIVKRRIPGIHQVTQIDSTDITDLWEPIEEGLYQLETTRHVSSIQITLSTLPLDTTAPGYQPPLPLDQVHPINIEEDSDEESDTESSEPKSKSKPAGTQPAQPPTSKNAQGGRGGRGKRGRGGSERGRGRGGAASTVPRDGAAAAAPAGTPTDVSGSGPQQQSAKARSGRGGRGGRGGAAPVGVGAPVPYYMDVRRQLDDMYRPGPTLAIPPNAIPAGYVPVIAPTSLPLAVPHYQGGRGRGGHAAGLPLMPVPITMVPIHQSQAIHHPFQQQGVRGGRGGRGGRGDGIRGGHRGGRGGKGGARGNTTTTIPGATPTPAAGDSSSSQTAEQQPQSTTSTLEPATPASVPPSSTPASASSSTEPSAAS